MITRLIPLFLTVPLIAGGLPKDKQLHIAAGVVIGGTVTWIAKEQGAKYPELWGSFASILAGALKEAVDRRSHGNRWDGNDLAYTAGAGIVVSFSFKF